MNNRCQLGASLPRVFVSRSIIWGHGWFLAAGENAGKSPARLVGATGIEPVTPPV